MFTSKKGSLGLEQITCTTNMRIILEDTDIKNLNVTGYKRIVAGPLADTQGAPQGPPEIQNVTHGKCPVT